MSNPDELGALWIKSGPKGEYMTGTIGGVDVVAFPNTRKRPGSREPDWRVLKSRPRGEQRPAATSAPAPRPPADLDDEIPW